MAIHSSILAWRIPWTEDPGGLQSTGSQSQTRLSDFTSCEGQRRKVRGELRSLCMRTCWSAGPRRGLRRLWSKGGETATVQHHDGGRRGVPEAQRSLGVCFPGRVREDFRELSPANPVREGRVSKGHSCRKEFVQSSEVWPRG